MWCQKAEINSYEDKVDPEHIYTILSPPKHRVTGNWQEEGGPAV